MIRMIVGLGNPGAEYAKTRHNAGFWFLDALQSKLGVRCAPDSKLHAEACKTELHGQSVWLLKPSVFMNRSGQSVNAALNYYKIDSSECLVVHDELDLAAGNMRLKFDGGHGGQNGLRDIMGQLGHGKFHRLRVGIGHPGDKDKVTPWVLGRPSKDDEAAMLNGIDRAIAVLPQLIAGDINAAMKQLHTAVE